MEKIFLVLWLMLMAGWLGYGIGRFKNKPRFQTLDIRQLAEDETLLLLHKAILNKDQRQQIIENLKAIEADPRRVFVLDGNFRALRMKRGFAVDLFPEDGK